MNDADIIKALKCCVVYHQCEGCPCDFDTNGKMSCMKLGEDIFDLINRQKAEIERLKSIEPTEEVRVKCEEVINKIRAEAIKEFADALKSKSELVAPSVWAIPYRAVAVADIETLVKQMTGGEP